MSKKSLEEKRILKKAQLVERTVRILGLQSEDSAIELLNIGRQQAMRVNPLHPDAADALNYLEVVGGVSVKPSGIYKDGYFITEGLDDIKKSAYSDNGLLYIQNAASWLPVLQLNPKPGEEVLDVCAAPGGKTSLLAAVSDNKASITANDNSRPRLIRLKANMERLGADIAEYTLYDASRLTHVMPGRLFDKILLDAPCSGEGMMQYSDDKSFDSWSIAQIKRLGKLQRRLIAQAWQLLKPGGELVYSTCTMAPEENEAVVDYLLRHSDDAEVIGHTYPEEAGLYRVSPLLEWQGRVFDERIQKSLRLAPSQTAEAFYVCHLKKSA